MKRIINLLALAGVVCGFASCNLDLEPDTSITGSKAAQLKYVAGMRSGLYNQMLGLTSYGNLTNLEYYTDLFTETAQSGNRGGFFARWTLQDNDGDIQSYWSSYYSVILQLNYAIMRAEEAAQAEPAHAAEIEGYLGEFYFLRAYCMNQLMLRFCEDYEPGQEQPGVPYPRSYSPGSQLSRGTLAQDYALLLEDLDAAEARITTQGVQSSKYVTLDAVTAFRARIALQMHEYELASEKASSLYAKYPLANTRQAVENMWRQDNATEQIVQLEVTRSTYNTISAPTDYLKPTVTNNGNVYNPGYVPTQTVCDLFSEADYRWGVYMGPGTITTLDNNKGGTGTLMLKMLGNVNLNASQTAISCYNMPKLFRTSELYLIDAEAKYHQNGGGAAELSTLRQARGLAATTATGDELFQQIKDEWTREFIGEGFRLFNLKRWHEGFRREPQEACLNILGGGSGNYEMEQSYGPRFTWPIPLYERQNNPNFGAQNEGWGE